MSRSCCRSSLPLLWADETKVKQITLNLLSNAVKFTERGGRVTIGAAVLTDGGLSLSVIDTGIGMRSEDIPKAMTPFGQLESTFERRFEGTGLGLPLVQRLVELHGAEFRLESHPRQGHQGGSTLPARPRDRGGHPADGSLRRPQARQQPQDRHQLGRFRPDRSGPPRPPGGRTGAAHLLPFRRQPDYSCSRC